MKTQLIVACCVALAGCASTSSQPSHVSETSNTQGVISLPEEHIDTSRGRLGWNCHALLRSDFQLHRGEKCEEESWEDDDEWYEDDTHSYAGEFQPHVVHSHGIVEIAIENELADSRLN